MDQTSPGRQLLPWMLLCVTLLSGSAAKSQELNLNDLPNRLTVPPVVTGEPSAGLRVWQKLESHANDQLAHALYLPTDWERGKKYPVIFEYPGNGGYANALGDESDGTMEGCRMGYGLTEGHQAIWVCLPFVDKNSHQHALNWWGDPDETAAYCQQAAELICDQWGGDRQRLVLCGFSRGALATSYIGLRNDKIARLWRGLISHSHFDGVRRWSYADSDPESAVKRQKRFAKKPQWISHEQSVTATTDFLRKSGLLHDRMHLVSLPHPNHSSDWLLKDLEVARQARQWWQQLITD